MTNLKTHYESGTFVLVFSANSILNQADIESIEGEMLSLADRSAFSRIVVDLQNVEFMSSALIGVFIRFQVQVRKNEPKLKLCNASDDLTKVLKVTKLDSVFDNHKTRRAAIESFQIAAG